MRYYKAWTHEGGAATPFIAHWPAGGLQRGSINRQPGHIIDIMPTLLAAAGLEPPTEKDGQDLIPFEGVNLLPAWQGGTLTPRSLYWEHFGRKAILEEPWKLVQDGDQPWELYHMPSDRTEENDRVTEQPDRVQRMLEKYEAWAQRIGVRQ